MTTIENSPKDRGILYSRRIFLGKTVMLLTAAVGLESLLLACGKDETTSLAQVKSGGNCTANGTGVTTEVVHSPNHTLIVPKEDVAAGRAKTYTLTDHGTGHIHEVTLSVEDFISLQGNQGVTETSTSDSGHTHFVIINCA